MEYRFQLFQKILELWELTNSPAQEHDIKPLLFEINKLIQLYGYNLEIKVFKEVVKCYNKLAEEQNEGNRQKLLSKFNDFFSISFNAYRKEIVLEKLSI